MRLLAIAIAFFCGYVCYTSMRRLEFTEREMEEPTDAGWTPVESRDDVVGRISSVEQAERAEARKEEKVRKHAERIDRVLEKIQSSGMDSLSFRERRLLRKATRQRRREDS